ncbi:hypothetical protein LSCM1_01425 [Leishmania martiniquensis]|uniref:Uncharacterized protein n=1 Tax=Leishmania martiniquensis TaxID=1580590 RepID=A0A836GD99_9TRYP|nr:hypothetical protein LSCM1_01425 [Leishmania martiniquensis]
MSTSPSRGLSSGATRRVSFFHMSGHSKALQGALGAVAMADASSCQSAERAERREGARREERALRWKSSTTSRAPARDSPSTMAGRRDLQAMKASERAGDASTSHPSCRSFPAACPHEKTEWPSASCNTMTLEFSLEGTPLAKTMRPPVWRESVPSSATCSSHNGTVHLLTPTRRGTTVSDTRDSTSAREGNLYTDVEREISNQIRRHIVGQQFFLSHEDAIRLYIRLEQTLRYRDLCDAEFRERLQAIPSEEKEPASQASACGGHATETACEIEQLQAALAHLSTISPRLAEACGGLRASLAPLQSLPSSHHAATAKHSSLIPSAADVERAGGPHGQRPGRSRHKGGPATNKKADAANSSNRQPAAVSQAAGPAGVSTVCGTVANYSLAESSSTLAASEAAKQAPPSQPRTALEAWRSARRGDVLSVAPAAKSAEPSTTASAGVTRSCGFTPRDSPAVSHLAQVSTAPTPEVAEESGAASEAKSWSKLPPLSPPRKGAAPSADTNQKGIDAARATPPRHCAVDSPCVTTPRNGHRGTLSWLRQVSAQPDLASPPPQPPLSPILARDKVAGATSVKPQRPSAVALLRSKAIVDTPERPSLARTKGQPAASSLTDSPLARYRAKQGSREPESHSPSRLADTLPQASSAVRSPPCQEMATSEASGVPAPEKEENAVVSPRASAAAKKSTPPGLQHTAVQQRQRFAPMGTEGRPTAARDVRATESSERRLTSAALGATRNRAADAAVRPSSAPSPKPTERRPTSHRLPLEAPASSSAAAKFSPPDPKSSVVPAMRSPTRRSIVASTEISYRSTVVSGAPLSDAQHTRADLLTGSASVSPPRSAAPSRNHAASDVRTGEPVPVASRDDLSAAAGVVGARPPSGTWDSLTRNEALSSRQRLTEDVASWPPEEAHEAEASAAATSAAVLCDVARQRSAEPHTRTESTACEEVHTLHRRIGVLEKRTTALESNQTKRAVLEGIQNLKVYASVVEERATLLERQSGASSLHIGWHSS